MDLFLPLSEMLLLRYRRYWCCKGVNTRFPSFSVFQKTPHSNISFTGQQATFFDGLGSKSREPAVFAVLSWRRE
jgi:hypothetical protein